MGEQKYKKYFAMMMTTALLAVPTLQVFADDSSNANGDKASVTNLQGINAKASTGKHVITLITGDVVTVTELADGQSVINVEPAKAGGGARILTVDKDTYVIPDQAMPYLASGFLDQDLFNVTALIEDGYDDASQKTLPVIVQYSESKSRSGALPTPKGSKKTHVLESINGLALSTDKKEASNFWQDITKNQQPAKNSKALLAPGIEKIWLDGRVEATLEKSVPQIGAPAAWDSGYDGSGVKVAVLDTGIDAEHPDIASQLVDSKSFVPNEDARDFHAHGTHVASTVLGTGAASEGKNKGVAPGADLLVGKVLSNEGYGQDSWIIDGMEWAAQNAKIVNMSIGSNEPSDGTDPMAQAVNNLTAETGALFVIAAGNTGAEGINSPGSADSALTVGAVNKSDNLAWFSSKGPQNGISGLKPDLTAPGVGILAARSQFSDGSGSYRTMDGTSMATPHVAGAAAILAQRHPDWTGVQLKDALMSTTKKLDHIKPFEGGTGRLDVAAATFGTVRATGSLDFGFYDWPHDDDGSVEKTITYTNDGDEAVTLDLSTALIDSNGAEVPSGLFTLSTNKVTIEANSSTEVKVTLNPQLGALGARYQGHISANLNGQTVAHTSLGMIKEEEKYSLTINAIDRDGTPADAYFYLLGPDGNPHFMSVKGSRELRLLPGTYSVMGWIEVDSDTDHRGIALVGNPEINLNGSQTVELDARKAEAIEVNVPNKTEATYRKLEYYRNTGESTVNDIYIMPVWVDKMYAQPTKEVEKGEFTLATRWRLAEPMLTINFQGKELDDIPQPGSKLFKGIHNLETVYAGKGAPEDYNGLNVKDKAVVVLRSGEVSGPDRAAAALAAGAKFLIIVNDGPRELSEWVGIENEEDFSLSDTPLAVAGISGTEGQKLIEAAKAGKVTLNVKGKPDTEFVYDLVDMHHDAVPSNLTYSPKTEDLVKIDSKYKSDRPAPGAEFRYDILSHSHHGVGFLFQLALPSVRTEWVSAQEGTSWYHQANVQDAEWEVREPKVTYTPGQKLEEEWFSPVVRPRLGEGFWVPYRDRNSFVLNIPVWADSGFGHTGAGMDYTGTQTLEFYRGDTLVKKANGQALYSFVAQPEENTMYRIVSNASRPAERWNTSVRTHTEWTFWSKKEEETRTALPLLSLDYKIDTDMNGNGIAGKSTKLELSAVQIAGAPGNGAVEGASLEVSFDEGQTWNKVELAAESNGWTATIKHPSKAGSNVSLRASAWDDKGNSIKQEVIKAYGLR